ncbi:MAG: hypothetical protein HND53_02530 [Proteobacteria bacterium]|nr:response regulator [Pseudomonadota bacterium]NOG59348.1 hypothetical protein [Pseudomonadota bacterium]
MTRALVVDDATHTNENLLDYLHDHYKNWDMVEIHQYEYALKKIQTESFDVLTLDAHIPSKDCQNLVDTLHDKQPEAKIYIAMNDSQLKTDYSRVINRGLILVPDAKAN